MNSTAPTSEVLPKTGLPGAYNWTGQQFSAVPRQTTFVYDYGHGCANLAEADRNFSILTGTNATTTLVSVRPFDTTSAGIFTYSAAKQGEPGDLFITNVAPGLNVANGTEGNIREGFFGTVLRNGVVVTGTNSSDLLHYVAAEGTPIFDIGYDKDLKSQIRGRDAFPKSALSFFATVQSGVDLASEYERVELPSLPLPSDSSAAEIIYHHSSGTVGEGTGKPRHYLITDRMSHWNDRHAGDQVVPIANPDADAVCAGFNASQIALGGQLCQLSAPPAPAIVTIDIEQSRQSGVEIWAQYWSHDVLIIGPADVDSWKVSGVAPIHRTGQFIDAATSVHDIAQRLWDERTQLPGETVDRSVVRLGNEPLALRVDPFGNVKFFMPNIELFEPDTPIEVSLDGQTLQGKVLERLFDNPVGTIAATRWGSSGGWEVPGWGSLRIPELIRRCSEPSEFSIAGLVGLTPSHGTFQTPRTLEFAAAPDNQLAAQPAI